MMIDDHERAAYHLNRRRGGLLRPKAAPQTDALFDEPEHQARQLVSLAPVTDGALFAEPEQSPRRLVHLDGWPDYRAAMHSGGGDAA